MDQLPSLYGGRGPHLLAISVSLSCITTICVFSRIFCRDKEQRKTEKYAIIWLCIGWFWAMLSQCFLLVAIANGTGNHANILLEHNVFFSGFVRWAYSHIICCIFAIGLSKPGMVCMIRVIQGASETPWSKRFLFTMAILAVCCGFACGMQVLLECNPPVERWSPSQKCHPARTDLIVARFVGVFFGVFDFVLAIYPTIITCRLQMRRSKKIQAAVLLGLALICTVCAIVKTIQLQVILNPDDISYNIAPLLETNLSELWFSLIFQTVGPLAHEVKVGYYKLRHIITGRPIPHSPAANAFPLPAWPRDNAGANSQSSQAHLTADGNVDLETGLAGTSGASVSSGRASDSGMPTDPEDRKFYAIEHGEAPVRGRNRDWF